MIAEYAERCAAHRATRENGSPEQKATVEQREKATEHSRRAAFGLRLRASLTAPDQVWDSNPRLPLVSDLQSRFESTHAQNRSDELSEGCWFDTNLENGQGDGIRTRTVRVTGGDANCYITTLMKLEPLVGLAPTNTGLRNPPCCFWRHRGLKMVLSRGFAPRASGFANRRAELITP